jgi:hypothetical protein
VQSRGGRVSKKSMNEDMINISTTDGRESLLLAFLEGRELGKAMSADFILFWFRTLPWNVWHAWGVVVLFCTRDGRNLLGSGLKTCGYVCIEVQEKSDTQTTYVDRLMVLFMCQVVLNHLLCCVAGML